MPTHRSEEVASTLDPREAWFLEERGFLRRTPDPDDARAFRATLTAAGEKKLADARVTHDAVLDCLITPRITPRELRALERALGKVLDGCDA